MSAQLLRESVPGTLAKKGNRWRGVLARPGKGSSGVYSEEVLREYGPKALAPGAKAFVDHNPSRSVRDMIGTYPDGAVYEEGVGLVGELEVFEHWREFVEAVAPHAGLSIYMMGTSDADGNILTLEEDRQNGVDLVSYPGLEGSGLVEKLYESAKKMAESDEKPSVEASAQEEKEGRKVEEKLDKLIALFETFVTENKANTVESERAEADAEASEEQIAAAIEAYDAAVKAIDEAELLPSQVESLRAVAKKGEDVSSLIEDAKKIRDEAKALVAESAAPAPGRVVEGAETRTGLIGAWA